MNRKWLLWKCSSTLLTYSSKIKKPQQKYLITVKLCYPTGLGNCCITLLGLVCKMLFVSLYGQHCQRQHTCSQNVLHHVEPPSKL